ncbi:branched-chain amino acid aminotransferase [Peijinzhouia sedimentorum]
MMGIESFKIEKVAKSRISDIDFKNIVFGRVYSDHMFIADYTEGQWNNPRIKAYENISLSPANTTLHYGQSVFEGMKAYKMKDGSVGIFRPHRNFERINISAERMCIPGLSEDLFMNGLVELLKLDRAWVPNIPGTSLYIRPFIFATDEFIGIRPSDNFKFIIFTCPVGPYYSGAVKVKIETKFSRAIEGGTGYAKAAGNYGGSIYPAKLAQEKGINQLIWTDAKTHQYIEESGTMNVAFIIGNKFLTPPTGETILKGITRDSVVTLAGDMGLEVEERPVSVKEIVSALKDGTLKEAFGMGTAATIAPISMIRHDDVDYQLPDHTKWEHSPKILERLDAIKYGEAEDKYNWMYKI